MKLQRFDVTPLLAIAIGGLVGILAFGPQNWGEATHTTTVTTNGVSVQVRGHQAAPGVASIQSGILIINPLVPSGLPSREAIASGEVMIRARAVGDPQPLIYVNGELVDAMEGIHPDDIDRIEVLKGDAAVAAFGQGASVGVIQIFTKNEAGRDPGR